MRRIRTLSTNIWNQSISQSSFLNLKTFLKSQGKLYGYPAKEMFPKKLSMPKEVQDTYDKKYLSIC